MLVQAVSERFGPHLKIYRPAITVSHPYYIVIFTYNPCRNDTTPAAGGKHKDALPQGRFIMRYHTCPGDNLKHTIRTARCPFIILQNASKIAKMQYKYPHLYCIRFKKYQIVVRGASRMFACTLQQTYYHIPHGFGAQNGEAFRILAGDVAGSVTLLQHLVHSSLNSSSFGVHIKGITKHHSGRQNGC